MKNKIKEVIKETAHIGAALIVLAVISYDRLLKKRENSPYYRPIDF